MSSKKSKSQSTSSKPLDANLVFEDIFTIQEIDADGKKFDRVSRMIGSTRQSSISTDSESLIQLTLDYHSELLTDIYPQLKITVALAKSLQTSSSADIPIYHSISTSKSIADDYDYVMYGKVYKVEYGPSSGSDKTSAYQVLLSFGGLLMALESKVSSGSSEMSMAVDSDLPLTNATSSPLSQLELNQNYYLALRVLR